MSIRLIRRARLQDDPARLYDLHLADGRISEVIEHPTHDGALPHRGPALAGDEPIDAAGHLVLPGLIDPHLHLDIALSNDPARPGRPAPFVHMPELNAAIQERRRQFTHEDIVDRALRTIAMGMSHGTTGMRAQCHIDPEVRLRHLRALVEVRDRLGDSFRLQIVGFPQQGLGRPEIDGLYARAFAEGLDVMGAAPNLDPDLSPTEHLDKALSMARAHGRDLDVHADMALAPQACLDEFETVHLARRIIGTDMAGRVAVGHLCTLGSVAPQIAEAAIELIAEAEISVISQPDLYRLGRADDREARRGLTRVKELLAAGVNVTLASNNVRDPLRPLGSVNLLQEALILSYGAHMDSCDQLDQLVAMATTGAARALRWADHGITAGARADLVVLDAHCPSGAIADQSRPLHVVTNGVERQIHPMIGSQAG